MKRAADPEVAWMNLFWRIGGLVAVAGSLAGCAVGGIAAFSPAVPAPVVEAPAAIAYGAFLDGPVGQRLSAADRDRALSAEQDALVSGQRRPWRGEHGVYGYVEPAPAAPSPVVAADGSPPPLANDACRSFTSTVYLGGRPQVGHGRGCQNPDGTYRITG